MARDAFADFEGLQLDFVEINNFAALAEAALHEQARESFLVFSQGRELDIPEFGARIEKMNGVKEMIGRVLVNFGDDAGAGVLPEFAFEMPAKMDFLAHGKLLGKAKDAAIAADEHGFGDLSDRLALG